MIKMLHTNLHNEVLSLLYINKEFKLYCYEDEVCTMLQLSRDDLVNIRNEIDMVLRVINHGNYNHATATQQHVSPSTKGAKGTFRDE